MSNIPSVVELVCCSYQMSGIEVSINERVNGQLYSDVINSYVDINAVTNTRNIVPGSLKETVVQCIRRATRES